MADSGSAAAGSSACPRLPVLPAGMWWSLLGAAGAELLPDTAPLGGQGMPRLRAIIRLIPVVLQTGRNAAQAASHRAHACQGNASDPLPTAIPPAARPCPGQTGPSRERGMCWSAGALTPCAGWRQPGTSVTPLPAPREGNTCQRARALRCLFLTEKISG